MRLTTKTLEELCVSCPPDYERTEDIFLSLSLEALIKVVSRCLWHKKRIMSTGAGSQTAPPIWSNHKARDFWDPSQALIDPSTWRLESVMIALQRSSCWQGTDAWIFTTSCSSCIYTQDLNRSKRTRDSLCLLNATVGWYSSWSSPLLMYMDLM